MNALELTIPIESMERQNKIESLFSVYGKKVLKFVRSKVWDLEEAQDIAQDVWLQLSRQEDIGNIEQIGNWLFTVARNRVFNFYKKEKSIPLSKLEFSGLDEDDENYLVETESFNNWAVQNLPDEILEDKQFWEILHASLDKLPQEQREAFIQNELNDMSFKEMSEQTGVPLNTLIARKRYAVLHLRKEFQFMN